MSPAERAGRAGGYATGRATKSAIVARAAEAFAVDGFHGASMRAIARAAGVDHSTLLHHFGNKTGLLMAVLVWHDEQSMPPEFPDVMESLSTREAAHGDERGGDASPPAYAAPPGLVELLAQLSPEDLVAGITWVAERNRSTPGLVRLLSLLTAEAASDDHPARSTLQRRHHILRDVFASAVRHQREVGAAVDDGLAPEQIGALLIATWEGLQVYDALHPGEIDLPALLARTMRDMLGIPQV